MAQEAVGSEPSEFPSLLSGLDDCLQEIEEKFTSCGHKESCVDVKLERAKLKR